MDIKAKIKFLFLAIFIILIWYLGRYVHIDIKGLEGFIGRFPVVYAGIIFVILYVVVTFFIWLSKDIFRFSGAILFGAYASTILVLLAETINAAVLFYLSRSLGRNFVKDTLKGKYVALDKKISKANFLWLFLFRCVPLIPFRFLDLACGLTTITFMRYLIVVIIGSPLRIFWQQYAYATFGEAVFNPVALRQYLETHPETAIFLLTLTFIYLIFIFIIALKLKQKE
jgi:uncharacterized membrane protein YdjX (TVP38/TMEM64 family)